MEPVKLQSTVFALALLPVVVLLFAAVPCFSEPPVNQVVLRFPLERSLGKLYRMKIVKPADPQVEGALYAEARGNVAIPANTKLLLQISYEGAADLKPLASCANQDAIYSELSLSPKELAQMQLALRKTDPACQVHGKEPPKLHDLADVRALLDSEGYAKLVDWF